MSKIKDFIIKHDLIAAFVFFVMLASVVSLNDLFFLSDEQWNFGNIYKMINGGTIYIDNNVIITPLFFLIAKIVMTLFGTNFVVFRVYLLIIFSLLIFCTYLLLRQLNIKKSYSFIAANYLLLTGTTLAFCGANYNVMAMVLVLIAIMVENSKVRNDFKAITEGALLFLIFFTKQNIGALYILGLITYHLIELKGKDSKKKKIILKELFAKLFVAFVLLITALFIMHLKGNLTGFIDYCFLGLGDFNKNLAAEHITTITHDIASIIMLLALILIADKVFKVNEGNKEKKKKMRFILIECIFLLFIQYPIFNTYHIQISFILHKIYIAILFNSVIENVVAESKRNKINKILNVACWTITLIGIPLALVHFIIYVGKVNDSYINERYSMYYGMTIDEENIKALDDLCDYILAEKEKGNKVIIVSYKAMAYNMPLNVNNGLFDVPFIGNFGVKGEEGVIEKISAMTNTKILIPIDEEDKIFQESLKIREYIMNNLKYESDIEEYMIYSTK